MGQLIIPNGATVYADTSVLIYTIEEHPSYYNLLQPLWSQFQYEQLELLEIQIMNSSKLMRNSC